MLLPRSQCRATLRDDYAKTLHLEKLKAQPAMPDERYGRSSERLDGEIGLLELTFGDLEEGEIGEVDRNGAGLRPAPRNDSS